MLVISPATNCQPAAISAQCRNISVNIPNLVRQTRIPVFNFFSIAKSQKFERQKVLIVRFPQATISPLRATRSDSFQETQQLQISGKRRLRINSRAQASPTEPPNPCVSRNETNKCIRKGMFDTARTYKIPK